MIRPHRNPLLGALSSTLLTLSLCLASPMVAAASSDPAPDAPGLRLHAAADTGREQSSTEVTDPAVASPTDPTAIAGPKQDAATTPAECPAFTAPGMQSTLNLRIDNDLFGGHGQDQGYSNGLLITAVSPNLIDRRNDPCTPAFARWLERHLSRLHPDGFDQVNLVASFGHALFTPIDREATALIPDDRPYAAGLLFSLGYNARKGDRLRTSHLRLGWVGPSALGKETQDAVHKAIGVTQFQGWDNQLHDEPVFMLQHERLRRYDLPAPGLGLQQDLITHWGGALGNLSTYLSLGFEWRIGLALPDDFGSSPMRPSGENTAPPSRDIAHRGLASHLFLTAEGIWNIHDISLDGNTFKESHRVKRNPLGAQLGVGLSTTYHGWKFAFARYFRTREFEGQKDSPFFGSFTISRQF